MDTHYPYEMDPFTSSISRKRNKAKRRKEKRTKPISLDLLLSTRERNRIDIQKGPKKLKRKSTRKNLT